MCECFSVNSLVFVINKTQLQYEMKKSKKGYDNTVLQMEQIIQII